MKIFLSEELKQPNSIEKGKELKLKDTPTHYRNSGKMNEDHETAKAHSARLILPIPYKGPPNPKSDEVSEKEMSPT